jgi:hypothetical protein
MNARTEELTASVTKFLEIHQRWQNDRTEPPITDAWLDGTEELFHTFSTGDIPAEARELEEAVARFSDLFEHDDNAGLLSHPDRMGGTWEGIKGIELRLKDLLPKEKRPIETMQTLHHQNVSHEQIARMHGLIDAHGHGKYWLVDEEIAKPGTIMGPDGFPKPEHLPKVAEHKQADPKRKRSLMRRPKAEADKPCPETPRELWQQRLGDSPEGINQAAKMLGKPVEEVKALFQGFDDELASGHDDKIDKVLELAAAGLDAKTIGKKLDMEGRTVAAIVKRAGGKDAA